MISPDDLALMTVVELKKFAKENKITLGSAVTKAAIYEKITGKLQKDLEEKLSASKVEETEPRQVRRATIISDDGEEARPASSRPVASPAASSTGKNKPAFTLQGARAWHNPQPFAQQASGKFATQAGQTINTLQISQTGPGGLQPRRPMLRPVTRFGPEAKTQLTETGGTSIPPSPFRPATYAPAPVPKTAQTSLLYPQPGSQEPAYPFPPAAKEAFNPQGESAATLRPPAYQRRPYPEPLPERPLVAAGTLGKTREPGQPYLKDPIGVSQAIPELLATGDCGDGAGVLEIHSDGYGFLRAGNYLIGKNDVYVSNAQIRRFHLRNGDHVEGKTRPQRESDRYAAMLYITKINGEDAEDIRDRVNFDELTPTHPNRRIRLSSQEENDTVLRLIDLFAPIGYGQRAMIVAAPKAGKTTILKKIAMAIRKGHPGIHLMMLLVDERPEEVTDLKETVGGDILYSTFDEPAENHIRVSELVLERAMRLVERGSDVVILMDSLTRLSRAYNTVAPSTARVMSGGLAAGVLNKPKRFFGAARNLKEGGSLTVIATALIETGSRMDDVIFEEFKGTGNMELTLDRQLSEMRVFPAVSVARSGTRHDELLLSSEEIRIAQRIRAMVSGASEQEGVSLILSMMDKTKDNDDFVARFDDWMALMKNSSYSGPGRQY